jgi:isopenicillin-N epimerase
MHNLREFFLLDPSVIFLNHGSFGATPKPVFENYQQWQTRLEKQPVLMLGREYDQLLFESRKQLGQYLNADADDLVYVPNATHGVNIIARSLNLEPGDEVLTSDHEYGACDYIWEFLCGKTGTYYIHQHIPLPVQSEEEILELLWLGVTPQTKVIFLSHITSPTALRLPVEQICERARNLGIFTVIDAAHSPGQIPVDMQKLGADVVTGNCHKWMMSAKGAAFLYMKREQQHLVEPLIVSWGYHPTTASTTGSRFIDLLQWTGTKDPSAALTVPAALKFMQDHDWEEVRKECHLLLKEGIRKICDLVKMPPLNPLDSDLYFQMGIAPIPRCNLEILKQRLYDEYRVEVPLIQWQDRQFVRISLQGYNTREEVNTLVKALEILLPQVTL